MMRHAKKQNGSSVLEGMLAILVFSAGLISVLMLLSVSLAEVGNARYRSEASLLTTELVASMWSGDRKLASLQTRFGSSTANEFLNWQSKVIARLPGVTASINQPVVSISNERRVTITLAWKAAGDIRSHQLVTVAVITD